MATTDSGTRKAGGKDAPPVLLVQRETLKKFKGEIRVQTFELLTKYVAYHQKATGTKPNETELIDRALVYAFGQDDPFKDFLKNGGSKSSAVAAQNLGESEKGGAPEGLSKS